MIRLVVGAIERPGPARRLLAGAPWFTFAGEVELPDWTARGYQFEVCRFEGGGPAAELPWHLVVERPAGGSNSPTRRAPVIATEGATAPDTVARCGAFFVAFGSLCTGGPGTIVG
jgi:hypothetical protein